MSTAAEQPVQPGMADERTLEVHVRPPDMEPHAAANQLWYALQDAIDLASDQDQSTWLTSKGKRIAAVVPVEQAERGQVTVEQQVTLHELAARLFELAKQPVAPRGQEITRERWEIKMRGVLAQVFQQGMGVGWEKCAAAHACRSLEPEEGAVPGQLCPSCDPGYGHNNATYAGPPDVHGRASNVW